MASVGGKLMARQSNTSMPGATPNGSICSELRRLSFPWANRRKVCRLGSRFRHGHGKKSWYCHSRQNYKHSAVSGGRRSLSKDFRRCRVRHALSNYQAAKDLNREERKENAKPAKRPHSLTRYPNSIFILFSAVLQLTTLLR